MKRSDFTRGDARHKKELALSRRMTKRLSSQWRKERRTVRFDDSKVSESLEGKGIKEVAQKKQGKRKRD